MTSLQERIVELIPSVALKKAIRDSEQELSDIQLLAIAYHAAPNFDKRMQSIQMLEQVFTGELKEYAARILRSEQQMRDAFFEEDDGAVYELYMMDNRVGIDGQYLCSSYEAALQMIPLHYQEYDYEEPPHARYRIEKRRVFAGGKQTFSEDKLGHVVLLPGNVLYSVLTDGESPEICDGFCCECELECITSDRLVFPRFLQHGDAVKYYDYDQMERFGVVLQWEDSPFNECYIIPLNCAEIYHRDYENARDAHEHIPVFLVDRICPDDLPSHMQEDYHAYAAYARENE